MDKPEECKKAIHSLLQDGLVQTQHADIFPQPEWYVMNDTLIKYNSLNCFRILIDFSFVSVVSDFFKIWIIRFPFPHTMSDDTRKKSFFD